jgi:exosome complex RNA-binding protein Rrp4
MIFKVFKQMGKDVIINLNNIVFVKSDEVTKKTIIYSTTYSNEVDASFEEVLKILGAAPKKDIGF